MRLLRAFLILGAACLSGFCHVHQAAAGDLTVEKAWSRATVGTGGVGVIYMRIMNRGAASDRLVSVASPVARLAQVHETRSDADGMVAMAPVGTVGIPAHGHLDFLPGRLHVMLVDLRRPLAYGDRFLVDLTFEHAGVVRADVTVERAGAREPDAMPGMKM